MRKIIIIIICLMHITLSAQDEKLSGDELIKKAVDISTPDTMESLTRQINYYYSGKKREFKVRSWTKDGNDKMLLKYLSPKRVKGDKFLFLKGGEIYAYFSKTGRIRRIASSAKRSKMQGSDFSYEDMSMLSSIDKDFRSKVINKKKFEGDICYIVESIPKDKDKISYSRIINYIDKENFTLRKIEYFKNKKLEKILIQDKFKKVKGFYIAYKTIMKSIKNNTKTEMYLEDIKINVSLSDNKFNKNNLNR